MRESDGLSGTSGVEPIKDPNKFYFIFFGVFDAYVPCYQDLKAFHTVFYAYFKVSFDIKVQDEKYVHK